MSYFISIWMMCKKLRFLCDLDRKLKKLEGSLWEIRHFDIELNRKVGGIEISSWENRRFDII